MSQDGLPAVIFETTLRAALAAVPVVGGSALVIVDAVVGRAVGRARLTLDEIVECIGVDRLAARLAESSEFEALMVNALGTATRTGYEPKRRLLGRVVINAAFDDARLDESQLVEMALRDLEAVHIRALERIRIAHDSVTELTADEAEQQVNSNRPVEEALNNARRRAAFDASQQENEAVVATLVRTGCATIPMIMGGGIGAGSVSEFGRNLLDELRREAAPIKVGEAEWIEDSAIG